MPNSPRLVLSCLLLGSALAVAAPKAGHRPKLLLVLNVDQFSSALFQRYCQDMPEGLGLLQQRGVVFTEAYHDHAFTETGPGHATLMSGRFPGHTGIVENNWYDRTLGRSVYCVEDEKVRPFGRSETYGASPSRFIGTSLGDWLQAQAAGSRTFSLSGKDRGAVLMAGRKPTAVFWFEGSAGFTTSTAYAEQQPRWLTSFNQALHRRFLLNEWTWTSLGPWSGAARTGAWALPSGLVVRNGLPRVIQGAGMPLDEGFAQRFRRSPFFDQVTLEVARVLVEQERVGRGPGTDLFTLSLSATDYIGHSFGTGSVEMWDQLHRLDLELGKFLAWLRQRVPDTWVVLSSDHGGMDLPEALKDDGLPAERLPDPKAWYLKLNLALRGRLKVEIDPVRVSSLPTQIYLDDAAIRTAGLDRGKVLEAIQAQLKSQPEVAGSVTYQAMEDFQEPELGSPRESSLMARFKHSFAPGRSSDVMVAFKPLTTFHDPVWVANHGSPWDYDRRVPVIFMGPWRPKKITLPVRTVDIAPTLARELGITPAEKLDGEVLELDESGKK